jgi:Fic family protein
VRPGGLRDKVLAHLVAHPGSEFTPHEIHKVLGHSSGAIANALDTLVKLGEAEVATDKPRRFRRAAQPAGTASEADNTGDAGQDGTGLAGAA